MINLRAIVIKPENNPITCRVLVGLCLLVPFVSIYENACMLITDAKCVYKLDTLNIAIYKKVRFSLNILSILLIFF